MIDLYWYQSRNFGDKLSLWIVEKLSGQKVNSVKSAVGGETYVVIGSILNCLVKFKDTSHIIVWGTGFQRPVKPSSVGMPAKVHAVRGPLTADILRSAGIVCPDVYGDPGILMPRLYKPKACAKTSIGLVPHYVDKKSSIVTSMATRTEVKFIDILGSITNVIDQMCACDVIITSSLHGLIVADAYGLPTLWVEFSDKVISKGFKFRDYLLSIGVAPYSPTNMRSKALSNSDILSKAHEYTIADEQIKALYDACPFLSHQD